MATGEKLIGLTEADYAKLGDVCKRVTDFTVGPGLTMTNNPRRGITIGLAPRNTPRFVESPSRPQFFRITSSTRDGANWRWTYSMSAVKGGEPGDCFSFTDVSGAATVTGINLVEMLNTDEVAAQQTVADLPAGWEPKAVQVDQVVRAELSGGCWYFTHPMDFAGACSDGGGA